MALRESSLGQRRHVDANSGSSSSSVETAARVQPPAHVPAFSDMATASYHKLPNPLSDVIQRLPVVDGLSLIHI